MQSDFKCVLTSQLTPSNCLNDLEHVCMCSNDEDDNKPSADFKCVLISQLTPSNCLNGLEHEFTCMYEQQ